MKYLRYIFYGIIFSIILIKVEAISWFRIQEMFYFQSFHMYGVLFSAIGVALIGVQIIKQRNKSVEEKRQIPLQKKELRWKANIIGGILFGLGWAITGACPGTNLCIDRFKRFTRYFCFVGALGGTMLILKSKVNYLRCLIV
ncbi:MAG: YeeE/YedE family protein [Crocinitomicaceae bacterium]|nr:YeeE/YedE family protein [Crocinitomicaceae bacterium]